MKIEQAVILVGGRGERLKPLTENIPKPMVPVCGKPFLEYLVLLLKKNGIKEFLFLAGYLGEKIENYFKDGRKWGVKIEYSFETTPLGTGGAIRLAKERLDKNFFLLFGDSYLPIDYREMACEFLNSGKPASLAVYDNRDDTDVPFNVKLNKDKKVVAAYNKRKDNPVDFNYCDAGVIAVSKNAIDMIGDETPVSFEEAIYPRMIADGNLEYYTAKDRFYDIGTKDRLKIFESYILKGNK